MCNALRFYLVCCKDSANSAIKIDGNLVMALIRELQFFRSYDRHMVYYDYRWWPLSDCARKS